MDNDHLERLVEIEQREKSNTKRIDILEEKVDDIHELTISVKELALETKAMREDINKIDNRVLAIESKPAKKWDNTINYIISGIIGIIIGYLAIRLGLK